VASNVIYSHSFAYLVDEFSGRSFPGLELRVSLPSVANRTIDLNACLDTGAELSIFDGALITPQLGIDLMAGREIRLSAAAGFAIAARIHRLELSHPDLGRFALDAAISTVPITRNLLGRGLLPANPNRIPRVSPDLPHHHSSVNLAVGVENPTLGLV
jgi:hypothetical protein